uniref:Uncharacterized protein LOC104233742 n=1 Tax=Nicotiana sylvestris TaxID=4096 RepID=A0A1U7X727_NICSY|nr:PREDICTED: uncharacterized protein LOC104233742 [Nicotiana sylvestris]
MDSTPSFIEVGQVYQDMQTIATAMKYYSVMHKFQFRVKRSSARSGWEYYRPVVVVNGTFLKSAYRGIMLTASTMNTAESLNVVTKYARELPIVELLEYMRTLLERWMNEKLLKAKGTFTYLGFKFNKESDDNRTLSHKLRVRVSTDYIHTVLDGVRRYIICLQIKRCSCRQFQLDELPCPHVLAALRHMDESFE